MSEGGGNEELRYAVRDYLAARPSISQSAETIARNVGRELATTLAEVRDALTFLVSLEQVQMTPSGMGATRYFQITARGTLAYERGE